MLENQSCLLSRLFPSSCQPEPTWGCMTFCHLIDSPDSIVGSPRKRLLDSDENPTKKTKKKSSSDSGRRTHAGNTNPPESDPLIGRIGRDNSISCLIRCSRSDYGSVASLGRGFRSLIRSGELYRLRRLNGVVEHWVYFSVELLQWEAFDPLRRRWMRLPRMSSNECFRCSDKESLAVGAELLVFGKEFDAAAGAISNVIHRYSLATNSWSPGTEMNSPRSLFGSASSGEVAILAGGCNAECSVLSSAEMYNSEEGTWESLPGMNKPRKMCSGFFMDGKFYVVGGIGGDDNRVLRCGEEYDPRTRTWREIPDMSPAAAEGAEGAPPLVAVVGNELYAADYAEMEVKRYDKLRNEWRTVGKLPERAMSMHGWGMAFRACGEMLIVIGGPRSGENYIEVNSWAPGEGGPPKWNLLARKSSGCFVYNCAVMGC